MGQHMGRVGGRSYGGDGPHLGQMFGGGQHRQPAQAVTDQKIRRHAGRFHGPAGRDQILHVGGEARVSDLGVPIARPGEVEAQDAYPASRQRTRQPHRGQAILTAAEAVRDDGPASRRRLRPLDHADDPAPVRKPELELLVSAHSHALH
jgi:hypothetical protein